MKSLWGWVELYTRLHDLVSEMNIPVCFHSASPGAWFTNLTPQEGHNFAHFRSLPQAALLWRLESLREIVFSGFKLELYLSYERPFAYWYLCEIITAQLAMLDELDNVIPSGVS